MRFLIIFFLLFFLSFVMSCKKNIEENEKELLLKYISNNNITTEPSANGLYYIETGFSTSGSSDEPDIEKGDTVILSYSGYLLSDNSVVFDERDYDNPGVYIYKEDDVISGWEEAIAYMRKDISAKIIIPHDLAYGKNRVGLITPYSTLIFDLRIIDVR